jgi:class 3 adenylate cyclase/TolB-like protein/Flp pilus assembly protein TadD
LCHPDDVNKLGAQAGWAGNSMPTTRTMTPPKIERRLAAIMVADVAGYSRLMGTDEVGTLNAVKEHRRDRIDPTIARHNGRIFKATGDGLLVEFASVVDAVGCAVAIQRAMLAFNAGIHADRQIVLRIGINVGDIIVDGDDIFGDGVNVAARLEALCEPGGVCISRSANDQVRNKLSLAFADLGPQTVKNIAQSVGVFGLAAKDIATLPDEALLEPEPPEARTPLAVGRRGPTRTMIAGGVVLVAILAVGGWWTQHDRTSMPVVAATTSVAPRPAPSSPEDRRMSLIVLPFENSSGDPAQDGIAAGITRNLINFLAQIRYSQVIPAATSALYRGKTVDLQKVGREHNVHFALTGDARRQDERLIVSATLYEADAARVIWSQRFDSPDRGDDWNSVVPRITYSVLQASIDAEVARAQREHPNSLDKRDLYYAARATALSSDTKQNLLTRLALIERALAIDPDYVVALQRKALLFAILVARGFSSDRDADLTTALKAADRALQLAPNDENSLGRKARVLQLQGNLAEATALIRKAIEIDPQGGWTSQLGQIQMDQGRYKEALESFMTAKQLSDETSLVLEQGLASALLANDRFPEAIAQAQLAIAEWPPGGGLDAEVPWLVLIAAESQNGQDVEARAALQKFLATPRTYRSIAEVKKRPELATNSRLLEGLRRAGMPEE